MLSIKRDHYSKKIRELEKRIASLSGEIKNLEGLANGRSRRKDPILKRPIKKDLSESKRRLVSYLSTGSFQNIDLRRHEKRAAKIRRAILVAILLITIFIIWVWFWG